MRKLSSQKWRNDTIKIRDWKKCRVYKSCGYQSRLRKKREQSRTKNTRLLSTKSGDIIKTRNYCHNNCDKIKKSIIDFANALLGIVYLATSVYIVIGNNCDYFQNAVNWCQSRSTSKRIPTQRTRFLPVGISGLWIINN